jgi:hypothetical protein
VIVRTDWFRNMVREKIVAAVEIGTGGRVELGSFTFDWTHLRARCVPEFVTVTWAPAMIAPLASVTVPVISPNCCAQSRKTGSTMRREQYRAGRRCAGERPVRPALCAR